MTFLRSILFLALWLQSSQTGSVSGLVTESNSAKPLDNSTVFLQRGDVTLRAETNSEGRFQLKDIPDGEYFLRVEKPGYLNTEYEAAPLPLTIGPLNNNQNQGLHLELAAGRQISGRITTSNTPSLAGIPVEALQVSYRDRQPYLATRITTRTNDSGDYTLFPLAPGLYYVRSSSSDVFLPTYYPGVEETRRAILVNLVDQQVASRTDFQLLATRGVKLTGEIKSATPGMSIVAISSLFLLPRDDETAMSAQANSFPNKATNEEQARGTFEVRNIPPGSYDLVPILRDANGRYQTAKTSLELIADTAGITLYARSGSDLHGELEVHGDRSLSQFSTVRLGLQLRDHPSSDFLNRIITSNSGVVNRNGTFAFQNVPEAYYRLRIVSGLPDDAFIEDIKQGGSSVYDDGFFWGDRPRDVLKIIIGSPAGRLEGRVLKTPQNAGTYSHVMLVPYSSRRTNPLLSIETLTDVNGRFSLSGVAPGTYQLLAWGPDPEGVARRPDFVARYQGMGKAVVVEQGSIISGVEVPLLKLQRTP
jgi:hypothetical protein